MKTLSVFEHGRLTVGKKGTYDPNQHLTKEELLALELFYEDEPRYYTLVHNGVRFNQWVGLLRVGELQIEVLPKLATDSASEDHEAWRHFLLDILVRSKVLKFQVRPHSQTGTRQTMLDFILRYYLDRLGEALHRGLIKRYRRAEGNLTALKGKLLFAQQVRRNLVHKEQFYTSHTRYDFDHALNQLLAAALGLIQDLTHNLDLRSGAARLGLALPRVSEISHPENLIGKIRQDRKSVPFQELITFAGLIVENYHPSLSAGKVETFSLMFDMNRVFESWLQVELNAIPGVVAGKRRLPFFQASPESWPRPGEPDLVVRYSGNVYMLDAKWKKVSRYQDIGVQDLRQIYAYLNLFPEASLGGLIFPAIESGEAALPKGAFRHRETQLDRRLHCRLGSVPVVVRNQQGKPQLRKTRLDAWFEEFVSQ